MSTIDFRGETHIREGLGVTPVLGKRVMITASLQMIYPRSKHLCQ